MPFQSCNSIHPRKFKYCGVFSSLKSRGSLALLQSTTPKVLWLDTKTESEDEFDIHDCAFEVAFDECTQLYIQWCICIHRVEFHLSALGYQNTARAVASRQKGLWGWNGYAQICNKANFPKHSTEGRQVTSFFHAVIIFTVHHIFYACVLYPWK